MCVETVDGSIERRVPPLHERQTFFRKLEALESPEQKIPRIP
ncbi:hypothetical protein BRCON_2711 [Candidatus Sumerlaea chitinivorans]|uniref:Uncharacterized protein n=1 Tax=Sumerlaea chitinivorans TaxID=2250252 RepID=A0A2Z4YAK4_SUMC1|nr:hypothetical protein BRCON_2711 [Candidatus Sumerlaea chitinivorans]